MQTEYSEPIFGVSDFVAVFNQTIEYAYPTANIIGEVANFKISKGRWVYFDLKDEDSSIRCFGTVYQLPGPISDGIIVQLKGQPRLHPKFGFSVNLMSLVPVGEGSIKKVSDELKIKLQKEGLFKVERKRELPFPPSKIGLITSGQSAAYGDFVSTINKRWVGVDIELHDVQVQGIDAPSQIVGALEYFNKSTAVDVIVVIRGGGSADDLQAFNSENVVRAVASSRIPTLVAIGHEIDLSLAEIAADAMAITPTEAAITLVPEKRSEVQKIRSARDILDSKLLGFIDYQRQIINARQEAIEHILTNKIQNISAQIKHSRVILDALNPNAVLKRGYSIIKDNNGKIIRSTKGLTNQQKLRLELFEGSLDVSIDSIK